MSQNTILLLQSIGITVQMLNAGLATLVHNPAMSVFLAAVFGGYQFYVQRLGNASTPPPKP